MGKIVTLFKEDIVDMAEKLPRVRDEIVTAWQEGRGQMRMRDIIKMINWSFNLTADDNYQLRR